MSQGSGHIDLRKSRSAPQANVKRLLAYSSIAHANYLLIGVNGLSRLAISALTIATNQRNISAFLSLL